MRLRILCAVCLGICLFWSGMSVATPIMPVLDLSITGPDSAASGQSITVYVNLHNTGSALGGLKYTMLFSEPLALTHREYSNYGWEAGNGSDKSSPPDGDVGGGSLSSIVFDTRINPELPADPLGIVEVEELTLTLPSVTTSRNIYFTFDNDNGEIQASRGIYDWEDDLYGDIYSHDYSVYVHAPEPLTLTMLAVGLGIISRMRRRSMA
jgi:hypothetical protein